MSTKIEVTKEVTKSVRKHVNITAEQIGGLLKKAVGAPDETPLDDVLNDGSACGLHPDMERHPEAPRSSQAQG
ncbi:MAG: hypothetical protein IPP74_13150 [Alphaproteobacteria bacterium]|nr:hypothetical protein [Alphaproteobacteria bacterium]